MIRCVMYIHRHAMNLLSHRADTAHLLTVSLRERLANGAAWRVFPQTNLQVK